MDTRKRKRVIKPLLWFPQFNLLSMKTLMICFCFVLFFVLLSQDFRTGSGRFRPARIVTKIPVLGSSIVRDPVRDVSNRQQPVDVGPTLGLAVEGRVLFSDHLLVVLSANGGPLRVSQLGQRVDCVYKDTEGRAVISPMLSADGYDNDRLVVRCPVPPGNDTVSLGLKRGRIDDVAGSDWLVEPQNMTAGVIPRWDSLAYEAALDGADVAVVFVKGLHLKSDRISDPDSFTCHFITENNTTLTTAAISAAQEVIRCPLPRDLRPNNNGVTIRVTVEKTVRFNSRRSRMVHQVMPTIAGLHPDRKINKASTQKHKLCACTMVWNQASFIREWITYHAYLGIERWFIYDNNSDDELNEVVNELNSENYNVSRHVWPWVKSQEAGFAHCVLRARDECDWIGFFDVDEFYYLPSLKGGGGPESLRAVVENISLSSPSVAEIRTDCLSFGPSGLKRSPERGVTLGYTCRLRSPERHKSIIRPDSIDESLMNQVHHFRVKKGFVRKTLPTSVAVINHYKYQVWDVFKAKFFRRVSTYVADWQENRSEHSRDRAPGLGTEAIEPPNWHLRFCKVWDNRLKEFILTNLADPRTGSLPWEKSGL